MNLALTGEQEQLRDTLRSFLSAENSFSERLAASRSEAGWREPFWRSLEQKLGLFGATLPDEMGHVSAGPVETMLIMEELGAALLLEPYVETVLIAGGFLAATGGREAELADIVAGNARYAFAWAELEGGSSFHHVATSARRDGDGWCLQGRKVVVTGAPWATHLLVVARTSGDVYDKEGLSLFIVDVSLPGVDLHAYPTIDGRRAADVFFNEVRIDAGALLGADGSALPLVEYIGDVAIAALGAEAVGLMRTMLDDTIAFTSQRHQFGQAIASFQILQHRMVDMYIQLEMAVSAVYRATLSLAADPTERARTASAAKVSVGKALRFIGQNAVQLHGGMGMTDELPISHYFKRGTVIEAEFGTVDDHIARYASLGLGEAI